MKQLQIGNFSFMPRKENRNICEQNIYVFVFFYLRIFFVGGGGLSRGLQLLVSFTSYLIYQSSKYNFLL